MGAVRADGQHTRRLECQGGHKWAEKYSATNSLLASAETAVFPPPGPRFVLICSCTLHILYLQHIFMYSLSLPILCALYIFLPLGLRGIFVCESVFICETLSCFCVRVWCSIMTPCFFFSALYFPFRLFLVHLHSLVKTIHSQSSSVQV